MSFKRYVNSQNDTNKNNIESEVKSKLSGENFNKEYKSAENLYNQYKNYSQDELTEMLYSQVLRDKQNGTFDMAKIENSINMILPYVSASQRQNLLNMLEKIR